MAPIRTSSVGTHLRNNFVGYCALTVALIGVPTAWAAAKNSVGSPQIKPGAVKTKDIANGAVTSAKLLDGSVQTEDLQVQGPGGGGLPPSPPGTHTTVTMRKALGGGHAHVLCAQDEYVVGGGGFTEGFTKDKGLYWSAPLESSAPVASPPLGWIVQSGSPKTWAYVLCLRVGQPAAGAQGPPGPPGPVAADQSCPADAFVSGIQIGQIVCTPISP